MKERVTINLDPGVHVRAREVARARRTTVSGLIEHRLRPVSASRGSESMLDAMVGSAELRQPAPGEDPLHEALHRRHIARRTA